MQTFLPYPDFKRSAEVLDDKRLGKQRVEAMQIINSLATQNSWSHHPAVLMWKDHIPALRFYANTMIAEWESRGFKNTMPYYIKRRFVYPRWFGDERLHYSHKCNLLRKFPEHYRKFWPDADPQAPYWWPVGLKSKTLRRKMEEYYSAHRIGDNSCF